VNGLDEKRTYSVDRLEGDKAILVDDDGHNHTVLVSDLPEPVATGDILQWRDGMYYRNQAETDARRVYVSSLQDKLRRRNK